MTPEASSYVSHIPPVLEALGKLGVATVLALILVWRLHVGDEVISDQIGALGDRMDAQHVILSRRLDRVERALDIHADAAP